MRFKFNKISRSKKLTNFAGAIAGAALLRVERWSERRSDTFTGAQSGAALPKLAWSESWSAAPKFSGAL